jgi:hypothetical protein
LLLKRLCSWLCADVYHGDVARVAGRPGSMQQAAASRLFSLYWGFVDIMLWKVSTVKRPYFDTLFSENSLFL